MSDAPRFDANPAPTPPPQRGWFSRNWLWSVPLGLLVLCVCPIGCCGGIFGSVFTAIKSSEPYQTALTRVQNDPAVVERLGQPIQPAFFPGGNVSITNDRGNADITFTVSGPKGQAVVHTTGTRANSVWQTDSLTVTFGDGQTTNLLETVPGDVVPDNVMPDAAGPDEGTAEPALDEVPTEPDGTQ